MPKKPPQKPLDLTTSVLIDIRDTLRKMNGRLEQMDGRLEKVERELVGLRQDFHEGDARIRVLVDARFELVNRRLDALEHGRD